MVTTSACLREFIEPTPTCPETADLMAVFAVLSGVEQCSAARVFHECLVLVDEQKHPKGLVHLHRLLPYLLEKGLIGQKAPSRRTPKSNKTSPSQSLPPFLVEPLMVLPGNRLVGQFLFDLDTQDHMPIAITGDRGEFLGLLDCDRLLRFVTASLAGQSVTSEQKVSSSLLVNPIETRHQQALKQQQRQINHLAQQILVEKENLEQEVKSQQKTIHQLIQQQGKLWSTAISINPRLPQGDSSGSLPHSNLLYPLLELLEQLPLPLMLQSQDGQILAQNAVWRQQMESWADPNWIGQEFSSLLDSAIEAKNASSPGGALATQPHTQLQTPSLLFARESRSEAHQPSINQSEYLSSERLSEGIDSTSVGNHFCHIGPKPGTCICICPLKNGQEQVLQFIKIPVEPLLSPLIGEKFVTPESTAAWQQLQGISPEGLLPQPLGSVTPIVSAVQPSTAVITGNSSPSSGQSNPAPPHSTTPQSSLLWLVLAQDITEQQHLARELTAKNVDLIHLNRLKDEFLACISHELRTPLTAVLGLSSLLKDQTLGQLNQRQVHYAQLIYQSSRHLMGVVNDILDLTRMETGQLELVPEPVDIAAVCSRAFEQAKQLRLLDDKHFSSETCQQPQFSLEIEPGLDSLVADEQRLRQMLCHLLTNAMKFTEPDQQIGLKVNRWGGWVAFTVWDRGIGIPADKQHLIFQKFQQLENPLTRRFEGTGLGLVLTQRLARLHGGDVTFISKEGEGSQFTILLPPSPPGRVAIAPNSPEAEYPQGQYPGGRVPLNTPATQGSDLITAGPNPLKERLRHRLVLLVEVVPSLIESLANQLTGLGYWVVIARSGTEALEKARRLQPGIIFLNPVLPLLSGWDVLTLLKSSPETRQIPVVVTATQVDEAHTHRSYADGWLSLPIQTKALRQTLKQLVTESEELATSPCPSNALTILRLRSTVQLDDSRAIATTDPTPLLHSCHYQVLEADDLEQAELLARVWKPNVVLLDVPVAEPNTFFQEFSHHPFLASLPLVTLDQETTQAANQIPGLLVFPCLAEPATVPSAAGTPETSPLLQVIQVAAGYPWRPSILAVDLATLPASLDTNPPSPSPDSSPGNFLKEAEWLQALIQYLQTAGLRGLMGRSWQEVIQQIQSQSIDLLLICWTTPQPEPITLERLTALAQLENIPPILVLDHRLRDESDPSLSGTGFPEILQRLASQILPPSLPMEALLKQIHQVLQGR